MSFLVLIVEDNASYQQGYKNVFETNLPEVQLLQALDVAHFEELWGKYKEKINVVVMDGNIASLGLDAIPLIKIILQSSLNIKIIAAASDEDDRAEMIREGCHYSAPKNKVVHLVKEIFLEP